jgi:hypothetical protein
MLGIPPFDIRHLSQHHARSALPQAPVVEDESRRRRRSGGTRFLR